jgi:predicted permease
MLAYSGVMRAARLTNTLRRGSLDSLSVDFRLAWRGLWRAPGFCLAAIATLALGSGASSALLSVAYGVSLRPLAYPDADRLVRIYEANPAKSVHRHDVSIGAFDRWRTGTRSFASVALYSKSRMRSVAGTDGARIITMSVSPVFFDVLGVRPFIGPGFKREREYTRFNARDVVLSHGAWQRLFGGRDDIVGATLSLAGVGDDDQFTVVGVMPAAFAFTEPVDVWTIEIVEPATAARLRNWRYDRVIGRLAPDVGTAEASAELEGVALQVARETPAASAGWTVEIESLHRSVVGEFGRATWLMLLAAAMVLLVAYVNVGALLVSRAVGRARDTAVRLSLGAGTWRLLRLWFVEAAMICAAGAAVGLLLAWGGLTALVATAPPGIPRLDAIALDRPAIAAAIASTICGVFVFAAAPLARVRRGDWSHTLRTRSDGGGGRRRPLVRAALTASQCAAAATLVILAAMFTRSFVKLTTQDLGWSPTGVVSLAASPKTPADLRRPWFARASWADRLTADLAAHPAIEAAAVTTQLPFGPALFYSAAGKGPGRSPSDTARWEIAAHKVTDGYFALMQMRLVAGRTFRRDDWFTEAEMIDSAVRPRRGVAIVTATTARTLWPGESARGQSLWIDADNVQWREVVGVVDDIQFTAIGETPGLHAFVPWMQDSASSRIFVLARSASDTTTVARGIVRSTAPGSAVDEVTTLERLVARATAQPRFTTRVVGGFAALSLLLAAVGIYGTLSYLVNTRRKELGIRVALGASQQSVFGDVQRRALLPAFAGGLVGMGLAWGTARLFRALLFEIEPLDAVSLVAGGAALLVVAAAAAFGPARRAARLDPIRALRTE